MSKDAWIAEHERILEDFASGDCSILTAGDRLRELGFDRHEIREQLNEIHGYPIPKGYFGPERQKEKT